MSEEWGPWQDHDGNGCPCVGTLVESEERRGLLEVHIANGKNVGAAWNHWKWNEAPKSRQIIRYRIRKPRGLTILENLIADLPAPVGPKVGA